MVGKSTFKLTLKNTSLFGVLIFVSYFLLFAPYGLDFTDEGLYLLDAGGVNETAYWAISYGQILRHLFKLVHYDIGLYRSIAFSIIVVLHLSIFYSLTSHSKTLNSKYVNLFNIIIIYLISFLFFNGLFIRTPGYNYLHYISILIFILGLLVLEENISIISVKGLILIISAICLSFTIKPTTTLFFIIISFLLILNKIRTLNNPFSISQLRVLLFLPFLFLLVSQSWNSMYEFIFVLHEYKTVLSYSQLLSFELIGKSTDYVCDLVYTKNIIILSCILFLVNSLKRKLDVSILVLLTTSSILMYSLVNNVFYVWILNVVFWYFIIIELKRFKFNKHLMVTLIVAPFIYVFGTSNSYFIMVTETFSIFFIIWYSKNNLNLFKTILPRITLIVSGFLIYLINFLNPYRMPLYNSNFSMVIELSHGKSIGLLPGQANLFKKFKNTLYKNGWVKGTELFCLNYRWSTTLPYLFGANTGNTVMTTIFGYDKSLDVGLLKIKRSAFIRVPWIMYNDRASFDSDENMNSFWRNKPVIGNSRPTQYIQARDQLLKAFFLQYGLKVSDYTTIFNEYGYIILKPKKANLVH